MSNKTKLHKIYNLTIKIAVVIVAFHFIYRRLFVKENFIDTFISFENKFRESSFIKLYILVLLLMVINWSLETIKWKYLIRKIENVSFLKALVAVLSGITVSIFTPNRIGEYAGRVFILEKADRWEGALITMLGSISQLLVTTIAGSVGFIFFAYEYIDLQNNPQYYLYGLIMLVVILITVLLLFFFNVSVLTVFINKLPGKLKKLRSYGRIFSIYTKKELLNVILISTFRYMVFITQFYLLLKLFGVKIPYYEAMVLISLIYLVMAAIPTIALTELGIRCSVALYFIGLYFTTNNAAAQNDIAVLSSTTMLWIINLVIPAMIGAIFVFRLKFFRKD
ncbi:MAG TPA: lysylphosphatidylglycerol synthase domain-containing protein [Bacteroidales bacterium]|nr:lysylphosphatidylglycerol synthase domain-containing protein [Bacteroidales bacterium]HPS18407.1 lysylphosphatidylglycerol synthase domain-containing protein [Bacteroidales bacterium]